MTRRFNRTMPAIFATLALLSAPAMSASAQPASQPAAKAAVQPASQPAAKATKQAAAQPAPLAAPQPAPYQQAPYQQRAQYQRAPGPKAMAPSTQTGRRLVKQNNRHGLGLSLGMSPGFGFSYRNYFGNTVVQATLFAAVLDRGDSATVWGGVQVARYLLVWQQSRRRSILPRTSALRIVGGGSYLYSRSTTTITENQPGCTSTIGGTCPLVSSKQFDTTKLASIGGGIGFEFGAIMRPGVSFAIDLQLTAMFDKGAFIQLWPLPSVALMYSW